MTDRLQTLDRRLVKAVRGIRVLSTLAWPEAVRERFLSEWRAGRPTLPEVETPRVDLDGQRHALDDLLADLDEDHPLEGFLGRTARSWLLAAEMLHAAGTRRFTVASLGLYGRPTERMHEGAHTHLEAARHFIAVTEGFSTDEEGEALQTDGAAAYLQAAIEPLVPGLPVVVSPDLTARATAGSKRVRLRAGTTYTRAELDQLLEHEALVHSATARNGRAQPLLTSLGIGAPRTTCTQEGLATFAELITDTMGVHRLRRIATRIVAVEAGLNGADFIEVFRIFLECGQTEEEACQSASRVFRGGDVRGGTVFTKDVVYLKGTLLTHAFLLKAERHGRGDLARTLFIGRLTWDDAVALQPFVGTQLIPAADLPPWTRNRSRLKAFLTWSILHREFDLAKLDLGDFDA